MTSVTVRNIPDDVMEKVRILSASERRSVNNEILVLLEAGLVARMTDCHASGKILSKTMQVEIWDQLCGAWDDPRSAREITEDIQEQRTLGRPVVL